MRTSVRLWVIVLALGAMALSTTVAFAAKRVALVIGNDTYETLPALNNARTGAKGTGAPQTASLPPSAMKIEEVDASYAALKTANVRARPSTSSAKLGTLARDSGVTVTGKVLGSKWLRVERAGGGTGYVFGTLLAPADAGEVTAWTKVRDAKTAGPVVAFLRRYPLGHFAYRAKRLKAALTPQVATVTPPKVSVTPPAKPAVGVYPKRYKPGDAFTDCDGCPEMVVIPSGSFRMGDLSGSGDSDEKPVHEVRIGYSFAVGRYEVTQDEWISVMGSNPSRFKAGRNPVEEVSWNDTMPFVRKLSKKTDQAYRLLSESEWEYVARSGRARPRAGIPDDVKSETVSYLAPLRRGLFSF